MNTAKKLIAILLMLSMAVTLLAGCNNGGENTDGTTAATKDQTTTAPNNGQDTTPGGSKIEYTVEVKSAGGLALSGINIFVYSDSTLADLEGFGTTDASGVAKISLERSTTYAVTLSAVPAGYTAEAYYSFNGTECKISLTSSVIKDGSISGTTYQLGNVIHDFSVVTSDGETFTLSEVLKTKKVVLLNFWYTTCDWCVKEFPYMNSSYNKYKDNAEIIALNHFSGDSNEAVQGFKASMGLDFPMAKDNTAFQSAFDIQGYPTTVVVDRYGVICLIEAGGIIDEKPFNYMFEHFTAENYTQELFSSLDEIVPIEKPNIEELTSEQINAVVNSSSAKFEFYGEKDDEMNWPFIITEKNGVACISPSNSKKDGSYSILYVKVELKKGDVFAFDYFSSSEKFSDVLIVLADDDGKTDVKNFKDIYQISGHSESFASCYSYVAEKDGLFEISLCYQKDSDTSEGDDTVYINNMRVCSVSDIKTPTYIPRFCANSPKANGFGFDSYVDVVLSSKDGFYHVGTEDGPLLLVDFFKATRFSSSTIQLHALNGEIKKDGVDQYDNILPYLTLASNSALNGLCPVNEELCSLLKITADCVGLELGNEKQWLQMCMYYDAYATGGVQLENPINGLTNETAYEAKLGKDNYVYYDRVIMPRGLKYKFVPEQSGAYRITSLDSEFEVIGWIFLEDGTQYLEYDASERIQFTDINNLSMVTYFEAGKSYYIDIAFYDVYQVGGFHFEIERIGDTFDVFRLASPGYFTYYENTSGGLNEMLALGVDVVLKDGYYYAKNEDGTAGSLLYADFLGVASGLFNRNIPALIDMKGFDFTKTEDDEYILYLLDKYKDDVQAGLKLEWGEFYEEHYANYMVDDVIAGRYHGKGTDMTEIARKYIDKQIAASNEHPELAGCVELTEELADLLQKLVDKYSISGVDHSFTKLCYYYEHVGP